MSDIWRDSSVNTNINRMPAPAKQLIQSVKKKAFGNSKQCTNINVGPSDSYNTPAAKHFVLNTQKDNVSSSMQEKSSDITAVHANIANIDLEIASTDVSDFIDLIDIPKMCCIHDTGKTIEEIWLEKDIINDNLPQMDIELYEADYEKDFREVYMAANAIYCENYYETESFLKSSCFSKIHDDSDDDIFCFTIPTLHTFEEDMMF